MPTIDETATPRRGAMKEKIDVVANVIFISAVVALIVIVARVYLFASPSDSSALQEGETMPALDGYVWQNDRPTLVIALQESCVYCKQSVPFYRRLIDLKSSSELSVRALAVLPDDDFSVKQMLVHGKWRVDYRPSVSLSGLGIGSTPTLVLVGKDGMVLHIWQGQLSPQREEHVVEMLRAVSTSGVPEEESI